MGWKKELRMIGLSFRFRSYSGGTMQEVIADYEPLETFIEGILSKERENVTKYAKECPTCNGDGYNVVEDFNGEPMQEQCSQCHANGYFFDMDGYLKESTTKLPK